MNLHNRKEPTPGQERLLSVVGFRKLENNYLSLANFWGNKRVQMDKLPGEYKQGDEEKIRD